MENNPTMDKHTPYVIVRTAGTDSNDGRGMSKAVKYDRLRAVID